MVGQGQQIFSSHTIPVRMHDPLCNRRSMETPMTGNAEDYHEFLQHCSGGEDIRGRQKSVPWYLSVVKVLPPEAKIWSEGRAPE
jgi:hypothetical protein